MVFSSLPFLFIFLPVFLAVYWLMPARRRNTVLLLGSAVFYIVGSYRYPLHILLLAGMILFDWFVGMSIGHTKHPRAFLITGLIVHFLALFLFKYLGFCVETVNALTGLALPVPAPVLPAGISFYTFMAVSYLIDVYRGTCRAERSLAALGTYITAFPHVISGPIGRYPVFGEQLKSRRLTPDGVADGLRLFTVGLGYKVLLANQLGGLWRDLETIGYDSISTPAAWMGIAAFSFQLYFDFYGYSLMAIGLGRLMGFELPENFRDPYTARSMSDFWRRWHITLGSWFRDYLYFPLGGSRCSKAKLVRNLLIVWLCTGLWHGAGLNYLLWGLSLFLLLTLEKLTHLDKWLESHAVCGHLYMLLCIPLTWTLFAITEPAKLGVFFGRLFPFFTAVSLPNPQDYLTFGQQYGVWLLIGLLLSTSLPRRFAARVREWRNGTGGAAVFVTVAEGLVLIAVFWVSVYYLCQGLNDPFMYFRF